MGCLYRKGAATQVTLTFGGHFHLPRTYRHLHSKCWRAFVSESPFLHVSRSMRFAQSGPEKKNNNKKTHKQNFHGTVPGLSRHFPEISWEFCLCVSCFPKENDKHINKFDPHPFPGQSRKFVYIYLFVWGHLKPVTLNFVFSAFWCPHFPHFRRFRHFLRPLFFWGERDRPPLQPFPCMFESLISKIRPTNFIMTGLR